jgi:hypothetical protein
MTFGFHPVWPPGWIAAAAVALAAALLYGCRLMADKHVPRSWIRRLAALRAVALLLFVLALLRPEIRYTVREAGRPGLLVLLDSSASMAAPAGGGSRLEAGLAVLRDPAFKAAVLDRCAVSVFAFDRTAVSLDQGLDAALPPAGLDTRLAESLGAAWGLYSLGRAAPAAGTPPPRLLLVSDGLDRGRGRAEELPRRLGLPVDVLDWPAGSAATGAVRAAVSALQVPGRILLGSQARLFATVRCEGASAARPVRVVLEEDSQVLASVETVFEPGEREKQVALAFLPRQAGLHTYAVRTEAAGVAAGPPREVSIRVESGRLEVLMLEPTWRWDFKFIRRVFEDDPHFALSAFLSRGPGVVMQVGEPDRRVALGGYPQSRAELSAFDVIILGNVSPSSWPRALPDALRRLVVEEGKSLIVMAGPDLGRLGLNPDLAALLPVELGPQSGFPLAGPAPIRVSLEGAASPLFHSPGGESWTAHWPDLPPMDRLYPPLRKKPAATVLLESADRANEYGAVIAAAEHTVGRGRVLFIGTDTLWKWQMLPAPDAQGQTPYALFWQQALRALQPLRLSGGEAGLWVRPERSRYEQGETMRVRAEASSARPLEQPVLDGTVTLPDGRTLPLSFVPESEGAGLYAAELEAAQAGSYQVRATLTDGGRLLAEAVSQWDAEARPEEAAGLPVNRALLEGLAAATGGRVIRLAEPATWPAPAPESLKPVLRERTLDLWNHLALLAALALVLGLDWLLRLMRGLAS